MLPFKLMAQFRRSPLAKSGSMSPTEESAGMSPWGPSPGPAPGAPSWADLMPLRVWGLLYPAGQRQGPSQVSCLGPKNQKRWCSDSLLLWKRKRKSNHRVKIYFKKYGYYSWSWFYCCQERAFFFFSCGDQRCVRVLIFSFDLQITSYFIA